MSKKEKKVVVENNNEETELLEETKELENDTKLNKEMLKLEEEITTLTDANKKLIDDNNALVDKVKVAQAELINYRRRKDEETASILKYSNQDLITELIPLVDNFERSVNIDESKVSDEFKKYFVGFKMMYNNLQSILTKYGVCEINRVGEVFDPAQEQALLTDCNPDIDDDIVTEVLLKGYKLKDRVIRPASVKINQK